MGKRTKICKIAGVYVGIIVGAGFASGKEIASFFLVHGQKWFWAMILTGLLFCFFGAAVLDIVYRNKPKTYLEFMELVAGKKIGKIMEWVSGIFLCILYFTMIAAAGAVAKEAFHIPYQIGVCAFLGLCFFVFLFDSKGVVAINAVLAPILVFSSVLIGIYTCLTQTSMTGGFLQSSFEWKWIFSAILYVSYNIITAITVLISLQGLLTQRRIGILSGIMGGGLMCIMGLCIGAALFISGKSVLQAEIPMLKLLISYEPWIKRLYIFMLGAAIFTTAVGDGFGALKWLEEKTKVRPVFLILFLSVCAALFSIIGFSGFVNQIYPLFGYLGLIEMALISFYILKKE